MEVPAALKSATVAPVQSVWFALPVGTLGFVFTVAMTAALVTLSHPPTVCVA